jgi:uncharacterized protein (TIGR03435 family)
MMIRRILAGIGLALLFFATLQSTHAQDAAAVPLAPMAAEVSPAFEVATIRPSKPGANQEDYIRGHHVGLESYDLTSIICLAYGINKTQLLNAPAWFTSERFDVDGVPDAPGQPSVLQVQQMVQKLLTDRFALRFHHDKRELALYVITVAKGGPKLAKSTGDPKGLPSISGDGTASQRSRKFVNATMTTFALVMQFQMDKPVLDQTNLTGHYDFSLQWARDDATQTDANAPPGFFTAIQEQLGLKMEPKKDLADVLIIDHAEKPSEN